MAGRDQTEVLVVGAGPVGLLSAVLLAEAGIQVTIIDEAWRTAAHSYACALHPYTVKVLDGLGLANEVLSVGHRLETIGFYEGRSRHLEVKMASLPVDFPFVLVLPQSVLEGVLERRLEQKGVKVLWNHRLSALTDEGESVSATVEKLTETVLGYSVPTWEVVVQKAHVTHAAFVIGADGYYSLTRQLLGISYVDHGARELYEIYEYATPEPARSELRIVLDGTTTSVQWPLPGGKSRWNFQVTVEEALPLEFPTKGRRPVRFSEEAKDQAIGERVAKLLTTRAPWCDSQVGELDWALKVQFEHRLAARFGQGRCWLVGDAAHQTSPVGMQSMNAGVREAEELVRTLTKILRAKAKLDTLESYTLQRHAEWEGLLGLKGELRLPDKANNWIKERQHRIPPCLPALGEDLGKLLQQVGFELPKVG